MVSASLSSKDAASLRSRAEQRLAAHSKAPPQPSGLEEALRLQHELQVHQVELEVQNEELREAQTRLNTLLEEYSILYELAPVGYLQLDANGIIRRANARAVALLGREVSALVGLAFGRLLMPASQPLFQNYFKGLQANGQPEPCEVEVQHAKAASTWISLESSTTMGKNDHRLTFVDVTQARRLSRLLKEHQAQLETLVLERTRDLEQRNADYADLYNHAPCGYRVMDTLDYGISEPKLALLKDGSVFIAGQIQAPMDPPTTTALTKQSGMLRTMAAAGSIQYTGSTIMGTIAGASLTNSLSLNQGVERQLNDLNNNNTSDGSVPTFAWKNMITGIANRNALVTANFVSTQPITDAAFAKLKTTLSVLDSSGAVVQAFPGDLKRVTTLGIFTSKTKFTFECLLDSRYTNPGEKIQLDMDTDGAVFGKQSYVFDPQWTQSQAFTVYVAPVTYTIAGTTTPIVMSDAQVSTYALSLENAMYAMYPISGGQLQVLPNSALGVAWDENPKPQGSANSYAYFFAGNTLAHWSGTDQLSGNPCQGWSELNQNFWNHLTKDLGYVDKPANQYYVAVMPTIPDHNYPDATRTLGTTIFLRPNQTATMGDQFHFSIVTNGSYVGGAISAAPPNWSASPYYLSLSASKDMETSLHEVGHQHGTNHTGLGGSLYPDPYFTTNGVTIGVPGWNWSSGVRYPKNTNDIMGYSKFDEWPSDHTFCIWYQHELNVSMDYTNSVFH